MLDAARNLFLPVVLWHGTSFWIWLEEGLEAGVLCSSSVVYSGNIVSGVFAGVVRKISSR
jgi:hypothetical protein